MTQYLIRPGEQKIKYYHQVNNRQRQKFIRRSRVIAIILIVIILGVAEFIYLNRSGPKDYAGPASPAVKTETITPNIQVIRAPYFQFQADKTWSSVPKESNDTKFVYRSFKDKLIKYELTVYVNSIPGDLYATHALVAKQVNKTDLKVVSPSSEHCSSVLPASQRSEIKSVTQNQITYRCQTESPLYTSFVGFAGGGSVMKLTRPDGSTANYTIKFADVTAYPDDVQLQDIVNSFQTR